MNVFPVVPVKTIVELAALYVADAFVNHLVDAAEKVHVPVPIFRVLVPAPLFT